MTIVEFIDDLLPVFIENSQYLRIIHPIRWTMPPKNTKKTNTEDRDQPEVEIVETVSSIERQILKKME